MSKQNHPEAFCHMAYECDKCGGRVSVWNSRDGITPFAMGCQVDKNCKGLMKHVDWNKDRYDPQYILQDGDLFFRNMNREDSLRVAHIQRERAKGTPYEMTQEIFEAVIDSSLQEGSWKGQPWLDRKEIHQNMITCFYTCEKCGLDDRPIRVGARRDGEDTMVFMARVQEAMADDHRNHSPKCVIEKFTTAKIPCSQEKRIGIEEPDEALNEALASGKRITQEAAEHLQGMRAAKAMIPVKLDDGDYLVHIEKICCGHGCRISETNRFEANPECPLHNTDG